MTNSTTPLLDLVDVPADLRGADGHPVSLEEDIERRPMAKPSDLILGTPGMTVGLASSAAGLDRGVIMAGGCPARTFIDGMRVFGL